MYDKTEWFSVVFLALVFYFSEALPTDSIDHSFNVVVGIKTMESSDWPPYGEHNVLGVEFVLRREEYPFAIEFEYLAGSAEFDYFGKEESNSEEFNVGLRYEIKESDKFMSYLGAGITYAKGEVNLQGFEFDPNRIFNESAFGGWLATGITWFRDDNVNWGFKIKKTVARADLPAGRTVDLGGIHYMFTAGFDY